MTARKLQALRNLAERPGTEAEGIAARKALSNIPCRVFEDEQARETAAMMQPHFDAMIRAMYE